MTLSTFHVTETPALTTWPSVTLLPVIKAQEDHDCSDDEFTQALSVANMSTLGDIKFRILTGLELKEGLSLLKGQ